MPELPDLSVFSQNLKKRILNRNIASVAIGSLFYGDHDMFCDALTGTNIQDIVRNGKELFFMLGNKNSFSVHLMLNGKFSICGRDEAEKITSKFFSLFFEDDEAFVISDFQKLCRVELNPKIPYTPDALSDTFTLEYFLRAIKRYATKNVKSVLIDQRFVRGIGNAYVDEILWKAKISPNSVVGKIPQEILKNLFEAIPFILNEAIEKIQKISPDIISGEERSFLRVHNPHRSEDGEGGKIIRTLVANKTTYYSNKQKLYK
jgi:formamidopyrimidine-DNA glycosylase